MATNQLAGDWHERAAHCICDSRTPEPAVASLSEPNWVAQVKARGVSEQSIELRRLESTLPLRQMILRLSKPTRQGDQEIIILTNLPIAVASATVVSQLYRERWQVEG
ncbi:MAG TPA: hypothetical protein V6C57_12015 [Coleofasciculaceae cyanobacterium]